MELELKLKIEKLNDWFQAVGLLGVIISLLFVGFQLRQDKEIATFEGAAANVTSSSEWAGLVATHADVWQRGCVGEQLTDSDRVVFLHMVQLLFDRKIYEYERGVLMQDARIQTINVNFLAANLYRYPGLTEAMEQYLNWMVPGVLSPSEASSTSTFFPRVQKRIAQMADLEPNPHFDAGFCGA